MRNWIALIGAGVMTLSLSLSAVAAPAEGGAPAPKRKPGAATKAKKQRMANVKTINTTLEKLNLTADQKLRVDALIGDTQAEVKNIRKGGGTPQEKRAQTQEKMKAFHSSLNTVLTADQQARLKTELAAQKPKAAKKPKAGKVGKKPTKPATPPTL